ncbi:hypothetical protein BGP75_16205 [Motiliproteus sp. MSK22-1]|nr:hypothetical protein BGP75_16205 [Motiliproteus sp. MSK22-1]
MGKPGREGRYFVKKGLTIEQKKRVALSIFMEVSHRFENFQTVLSFATDSGFSQEDLISNLIGFYIGIGEIEKITALKLCHPVSAKTAFKVWDNDGAVGKIKNRQWKPKYASTTYRVDSKRCLDECSITKQEFPIEFQKIQPAQKGVWYKERTY